MKRILCFLVLLSFIKIFSHGILLDERGIIYKSDKNNYIPINKIEVNRKILQFHYISNERFFITTRDDLFITNNEFKTITSFNINNINKFVIENNELKNEFPEINDVDMNDTQIVVISCNTIYLGNMNSKKFISIKNPDLYYFSVKIFKNRIYVGTSKNGVLIFDFNLNNKEKSYKGI
ncbi:hypothetical protein J7L48_09510 [bacterium]|nr:hypothetical protein [bacterium]